MVNLTAFDMHVAGSVRVESTSGGDRAQSAALGINGLFHVLIHSFHALITDQVISRHDIFSLSSRLLVMRAHDRRKGRMEQA